MTDASKGGARPGRVIIENVNHPGSTTTVDAGMYTAMRDALLAVLPEHAPGLTESQMRAAVVPKLPDDLFPGGARAGWWAKAVQLDLEAKGVIARELARPLRWHHPSEPVRRPTTNRSRPPGADLGRPASQPRPRPG